MHTLTTREKKVGEEFENEQGGTRPWEILEGG